MLREPLVLSSLKQKWVLSTTNEFLKPFVSSSITGILSLWFNPGGYCQPFFLHLYSIISYAFLLVSLLFAVGNNLTNSVARTAEIEESFHFCMTFQFHSKTCKFMLRNLKVLIFEASPSSSSPRTLWFFEFLRLFRDRTLFLSTIYTIIN